MTGICRTSSEERADFSQMLPEIERYRFTAKEWDEETGLYYMSARYMNPEASRWVSSDPAGWELINPMEKDEDGKIKPRSNFSIIESSNWYSYVSNNPINYIDPTGAQQTAFLDFLYSIQPEAANLAVSEPTPFGEMAVGALNAIISLEEHRLELEAMIDAGAVMENGVLVLPSESESGEDGDRIKADSKKDFKKLIRQLSQDPNEPLDQDEFNQLKDLAKDFDADIRTDLDGVKGTGTDPHAHVEGMGSSIESRHIWLEPGVQ